MSANANVCYDNLSQKCIGKNSISLSMYLQMGEELTLNLRLGFKSFNQSKMSCKLVASGNCNLRQSIRCYQCIIHIASKERYSCLKKRMCLCLCCQPIICIQWITFVRLKCLLKNVMHIDQIKIRPIYQQFGPKGKKVEDNSRVL